MNAAAVPLDEHRARQLTDRIRQAADDLWALLLEAHEGRAWAALGYPTWEAYVRTEFDMGRQYSYRLLDQGRVVREISAAAGVSPMGDIRIDERAARDLRPHLEVVKDAIRQAVENVPEDRVAEIVAGVVEQERSRIIQQRQDRQEIDALNAEHDPGPEFDWGRDEELIREAGALRRVIEELAAFRPPSGFVADHAADVTPSVLTSARQARDWLDRFLVEWEAR